MDKERLQDIIEDIQWYCWERPVEYVKNFFRNIKYGLKNFWVFKKVIWGFRNWDYVYMLDVWIKTLDELAKGMVHEVDETRLQRIDKIHMIATAFQLINNDFDMDNCIDDYISGKISMKEYSKEREKRRKECYDTIHWLLKGSTPTQIKKNGDDGSGIETWWD